jgi:hypothetical protein
MLKHRLQRLENFVRRCAQEATDRPAVKLRTHEDLIDLLREQIEAIRAEPWATTLQKARAIASLARVARQVIAGDILGARIEILETVLRQRKGDRNQ